MALRSDPGATPMGVNAPQGSQHGGPDSLEPSPNTILNQRVGPGVMGQDVQATLEKPALTEESGMFRYFSKGVPACFTAAESRAHGLTPEEAAQRLKKHGANQLLNKARRRRNFALQGFNTVVFIVVLVSGVVSFLMGETILALAFAVTLLMNLSIFALGTWKSSKGISQQESFGSKFYQVKRDRKKLQVPSKDIVPGDILFLNSGQVVPADGRLVESDSLRVDESLLTGEAVLVNKDANEVLEPDTDVTEQSNMVFAGTMVKTGRCEVLITATSSQTVIGNIMDLASHTVKAKDPFNQSLNMIVFGTFIFALVMAGLATYMEWIRGADGVLMVELATVLFITAVPQVLPAMLTIVFASGLERLSRISMLVKDLNALLALGCVDQICTDKTGTLTENTPLLSHFFIPVQGMVDYDPRWAQGEAIPNQAIEAMLRNARLNNNTVMDGVRAFAVGDPIDVALFRAGSNQLQYGYRKMREYPFDGTTLRGSTVFKREDGTFISFIKGAPEVILDICHFYMTPTGKVEPLNTALRNEFKVVCQELALEHSFRVVGLAQKDLSSDSDTPDNLAVFTGFVCMMDPPKPGVQESIEAFQKLKLNIAMITGDQKATAAVTAKNLGFLDNEQQVWTRDELQQAMERQGSDGLDLSNIRVFARTKPEDKLAIVEAFQGAGHTVAMIGDGVNDTPALEKCDVAIAMGIHGAESAKETASLLLLNDRLEGVAKAILESRSLASTINGVMQYILGFNIGMALFLCASVLVGWNLPLNGVQVLWLNIVAVALPVVFLAFDSTPQPPERLRQSFQQEALSRKDMILSGWWGLLLMGCGLGTYALGHLMFDASIEAASTMTFMAVATAQTLHLLHILWSKGEGDLQRFLGFTLKSPFFWLVIGAVALLQFATVLMPFMQPLLETVSLSSMEWAVALGMGLVPVALAFTTVEHH